MIQGVIKFQKEILPDWVNFILSEDVHDKIDFSNIDEVREKYRRIKKDLE